MGQMVVMKLLKRTLTKGEIIYESNLVEGGGHQSVVTVPDFDGSGRQMMWTGEVAQSKQGAEHNAARLAVQEILAMPGIADILEQHEEERRQKAIERKERNESKGKGKGSKGMEEED